MDLQNLAYALTQIIHNFGAVAVVGGSIFGRWLHIESQLDALLALLPARRRCAWLILIGWSLQAASGASFGAVSYAYYGQLPDIHGVAIAALLIKMACAAAGIVLSVAFLRYQSRWSDRHQLTMWSGQILLGITALTAAAFLRWFS